ncbi:hypothetical protein HMI54_005623 [Coelomomyces lativittatus]|nr:hypothetical protein HMI54_005623 [Coelomomyces lativittatus]
MQFAKQEVTECIRPDAEYAEYMTRQLNLKKTIEIWLKLHEQPYEFENLHEITVNTYQPTKPSMCQKRENSICFKNDSHNDGMK